MERVRNRIWAMIAMLLLTGSMAAQDIEIKDFRLNVTSLIGSMNQEKDNSGKACSVIRFSVRDTTFIVENSLGILKRKNQLGEILVYVPATTKRLTIRHEGLLPLRYDIPIKLEPKKTYDALLLAVNMPMKPEPSIDELFSDEPTQQQKKETEPVKDKQEPVEPVVKKTEEVAVQKPGKEAKEEKDLTVKPKKAAGDLHLTLGAGFQVFPMSGPTLAVGAEIAPHIIELNATYGLQKTDEMYFYDAGYNYIAARQYTPMRAQLRYGYELKPMKSISITPMIGGALNIFSSKSGQESSTEYQNHYLRASSFSMTPGVRLALLIGDQLKVHVTPEYSIGVYKSNNCKQISFYDSKFNHWTDGFYLNVGLTYSF